MFTSAGSKSSVPAHAVIMVKAMMRPIVIQLVKEEKIKTRNPRATDSALNVMAFPEVGGLHHHYERMKAA